MEIPFVGGAYEGRSKELNAQQSINLFPVVDNNEAKNIIAMYGTPGMSVFSEPAVEGRIRAAKVLGDYLYVLDANTVYKIAANGTATSMGTITTSTGYACMAENGQKILLVDGTDTGYTLDATALTEITDEDFPAATSCIFFDGYFVVSVANSGKIQISGLYDGTSWDATEYATAEALPDNLVRVVGTNANIWLLGTNSGEVYYNSGNVDFPFARVPGAVFDIGCAAIGSAAPVNDQIYWLSNKRTVVRSLGYRYEQVSAPGIDYQLSTYSTISDAIGFSYTLEGRSFYVLTFPTEGKTLVCDAGTGFWHEWQSLDSEGTAGIFRGIACERFNGAMIVGDKANGALYTLSMNTYTDAGLNIRRKRRAQIINKEVARVKHALLEVDCQPGVGLDVEEEVDGYDPQIVLKWSDDGGNTWVPSAGLSVSLGKFEEYSARQIWRRLGVSRNRIYEITIESPVKVIILGGYANLVPCAS